MSNNRGVQQDLSDFFGNVFRDNIALDDLTTHSSSRDESTQSEPALHQEQPELLSRFQMWQPFQESPVLEPIDLEQMCLNQDLENMSLSEPSTSPSSGNSESEESSSSQADLTRRKTVSVMKKDLLRTFRKFLKIKGFDKYNNRKHYHWVQSSVRAEIKDFFRQKFSLDSSFYKEHEIVFLTLILGTSQNKKNPTSKTSADLLKSFKLKYEDKLLLEALDNVFGGKNNKRYLRSFFGSEVIQKLWSLSENAFVHSEEYTCFVRGLTANQKEELMRSLRRASHDIDTLF